MDQHRKTAMNIGILFLLTEVTSITGLLLYQPILSDAHYIVKATLNETQVLWGAFFEVLLALVNIGTAITLYPILKKHKQSLALGTVCFRLLEVIIIVIGIISLLTIVTLNHSYLSETNPDKSAYLIASKLLLAIHNWAFLYGPNLMLGPSTFLTAYLLYRLNLVPNFITILGMTGGPLITVSSMLVMFGVFGQLSFWGGLLALPVFAYEVSLAIRLVAKGFDPPPAPIPVPEKITRFGRD